MSSNKKVMENNEEYSFGYSDVKNHQEEKIVKGFYVVHAPVAGAILHQGLIRSIENICSRKKGQQVIIPIRHHAQSFEVQNENFDPTVLQLSKKFPMVKTFKFNKNLKAVDLQLNAQNLNPLSGIERFTQDGNHRHSVIVAHPKQDYKVIPFSHIKSPHLAFTTGASTYPCYRDNTQGRKAEQEHKIGCVIIEIYSEQRFRMTQVEAAKDGSFIYDGVKYLPNGRIIENFQVEAYIAGDLHPGNHSEFAVNEMLKLIRKYKPENLLLHDAMDFFSLNHHEAHSVPLMRDRIVNGRTLDFERKEILKIFNRLDRAMDGRDIIIVPSNHNDFLGRRLHELRLDQDPVNSVLLAEIYAKWMKDGRTRFPEEYLLDLPDNFLFPSLNQDVIIEGYNNIHGDKSAGGAKGSPGALNRIYQKSISGHTHSPCKIGDTIVVGTNSLLKQGYNNGVQSWLHSDVIIYKGGQTQTIFKIPE
jgi:hypothetical protein